MAGSQSAYDNFLLARRIEVSGTVIVNRCTNCILLQRACVRSSISHNCSTCQAIGQLCVFDVSHEWDSFLGQLRELQAQEAFTRLELSSIVEQMNSCLSKLNRILLEKSRLVRNQPAQRADIHSSALPSVPTSIASSPSDAVDVRIPELAPDSTS